MNKKRKEIVFLVLAISLLAVLVLPHQVKAYCPLNPADCVTVALQEINTIMLEGVGHIIAWAAKTLEAVVRPETQAIITNTFVVQESWKIIRDFVNMFFILFLILMTFGTIFDIEKYHWRNFLPHLIIAALLINFSMVIGEYIIQIGNGLAAVFLRQIAGFSNDIADGFAIGKTFPGGEFAVQGLAMIANNSARVIFTALFSIVFLIIVMFAFIAALLFTVIRIPILWFLLIVSPIAWAGYVLPNIKAQTWSKWWNALISWTFFLPVYLFFLMFAVMFIRRKSELEASIPTAQGTSLFTGPGGALSDLLFYILTLIFMIFGLKAAYSVGSFTAEGTGKLMGKLEGGIKRYFPGAAYARGAWEGIKARGEQIKEKGILGVGGAQRAREAEARMKGWVAGIPGPGRVPGAREAAQRALADETEKELKKLQLLNLTLDQLNEKLKSSNLPERLAAFKLKAENGWLAPSDVNEINRLMKELGGGNSAAGASLLRSLRKGRFHEMAVSTTEKERIFDALTDLETRKAFGLDMAESGEITNADLAKKLLDLYKGETLEKRQSVEGAIRKNIKNFIRTKNERAAFLLDQTQDETIRRLLAQQMSEDGEINTYAKYKTAIDLFGGENQPLSRAMLDRITKDDPITYAEIQFRQDLGLQDPAKLNPTYIPTATEMAGLILKYGAEMQKMSASQLASVDRDKWTLEFETALQNKINELETVEPTQPAMPPVIDPQTKKVLVPGRKEIPGAGKRFLQNLKKNAGSDPYKLPIVNRLKV